MIINPHFATLEPAWRNPKYCRIDMDYLDRFAKHLANKDMEIPSWREPVFPQIDDERIIDYFGIVNSIHFCFTDFSTNKKYDTEYQTGSGKVWTGAYALAAALTREMYSSLWMLDSIKLANCNKM